VNTVMNFRIPYNFGKFLSSCVTGLYSRSIHVHEVSYEIFRSFLFVLYDLSMLYSVQGPQSLNAFFKLNKIYNIFLNAFLRAGQFWCLTYFLGSR
jgi:hypothetical protein